MTRRLVARETVAVVVRVDVGRVDAHVIRSLGCHLPVSGFRLLSIDLGRSVGVARARVGEPEGQHVAGHSVKGAQGSTVALDDALVVLVFFVAVGRPFRLTLLVLRIHLVEQLLPLFVGQSGVLQEVLAVVAVKF